MTMRFLSRDEGQGLVEYALILVLVAIVVLVILALLGDVLAEFVNNVVEIVREILS
jgi:pilus assembly protein Flp/PilA